MQEIERGALELRFSNHLQTPVRDIAEVLASLSDDYKRLNKGRVLVVADMREGSLIIKLMDSLVAISSVVSSAKEIVEGLSAVVKLGRAVRDAVTKETKEVGFTASKKRRRKIGAKTAEKLLSTALHSGGDVDFTYSDNDDQSAVAIKITRRDAEKWKQRQVVEEMLDEGFELSSRPHAKGDLPSREEDEAPLQIAQSMWQPESLRRKSSEEVIQLAHALHQLGMTHLAGTIQNEFIKLGRGHVADVFMREIENLIT